MAPNAKSSRLNARQVALQPADISVLNVVCWPSRGTLIFEIIDVLLISRAQRKPEEAPEGAYLGQVGHNRLGA
jgi:hypothetical protein